MLKIFHDSLHSDGLLNLPLGFDVEGIRIESCNLPLLCMLRLLLFLTSFT